MTEAIQRRARDFYAIYCASSNGLNFRGELCPAWQRYSGFGEAKP